MDRIRIGDAQCAISGFDETINIATEMAQAYHHRGKAYSILDRRGQAIQDFHEAIGSILKTRRPPFLGECHWMFWASINVPSQTMMRPSGSTLTMEWRTKTARSVTPVGHG